ncbi:thiamine diphosphokinase [Liquorilactobacillus hordei]|uniref:Thiamine diphosphokinase n=2 Tax=Liquorilactobacillus hordei TaxID=468911 RepID=A0A0R1MIC6_9LACO|nr:thiamine diphosphokinase [Liquorilactobacillus hordei]KRL07726.1 thiamine pyrophosphokinase [Liquorilactobacillus hordei DSM 19519]QYH52688.1 thiamine diphosphokinase [Liquorilactobacillus hordei DSM 19519]
MEINLLVGGPVSEWPDELLERNTDKIWVGADRGALRLVKKGIQPAIAIGDFDSSTKEEQDLIRENSKKVYTAKPEKDDTDTELSLKIIFESFQNISRINIFGATGGRIDHLLANLFFVLRKPFYEYADKIYIFDRFNTINFYKPGSYAIQKEKDKKYLAFVPMSGVEKLSLVDEKYRLDEKSFKIPVSLASNEFIGEKGHFSFTTGVVCVIQSKD